MMNNGSVLSTSKLNTIFVIFSKFVISTYLEGKK